MKKARLLSTVAAALLFGVGAVSAQGMSKDTPERAPAAQQSAPAVHLVAIADSWFELEAMAWFQATWTEFEAIRDRLLISCLEVVGRAGVSLHGAPKPPVASAPPARSNGTQPWPVGEPS